MKETNKKVGIVDPETHKLHYESKRKATKRISSALNKLDKELQKDLPEKPKFPDSVTLYTDKELLDFLDTQLLKGLCWTCLPLTGPRVLVTLSRVDWGHPLPTFRDAASAALDLYKRNLELMNPKPPKGVKFVI